MSRSFCGDRLGSWSADRDGGTQASGFSEAPAFSLYHYVPLPVAGVGPGSGHAGVARAPFGDATAWLFTGVCGSIWLGAWGSPPVLSLPLDCPLVPLEEPLTCFYVHSSTLMGYQPL
jgi:hypothetical protein